MSLFLTVLFGVVGVLSLVYAIWQNRAAVSARMLSTRVTRNIQQIAAEIVREAPDSTVGAYATSILKISGSLDHARSDLASTSSAVRIVYLSPQFNSEFGALALTQDSKYGVVTSGTYLGPSWHPSGLPAGTMGGLKFDAVLAWGPYTTLPKPSAYVAEFRLRGATSHGKSEVVYIDVYDYDNNAYYVRRGLRADAIASYWQRYSVRFEYIDTTSKLEFRVAVLEPGTYLEFDLVEIRDE